MLKAFMRCPLQAKFEYIDGLRGPQNSAASYGTAIHDAFELYALTGDVEQAVERFIYVWDNPDVLGIKPEIWFKGKSFGGYRAEGIRALRAYHESGKWEKREIIATEYPFIVPVGEHELSGIVDALEITKGKNGNALVVCDIKSGKMPYQNVLKLDIQFTAYIYASLQKEFWTGIPGTKYTGYGQEEGARLFEEYQDYERIAVWFNTQTSKNVDVGARGDVDFMRLYRCMTEIAKAVENDIYIPDISAQNCNFCAHQEECGIVIPVLDKLQGTDDEEL